MTYIDGFSIEYVGAKLEHPSRARYGPGQWRISNPLSNSNSYHKGLDSLGIEAVTSNIKAVGSFVDNPSEYF